MNKTKIITMCALFTTLTAICAQFSIPLPLVPISLATLAVYLTGGLLGPLYGLISIFSYLLLGIIGLPVFSNFTSSLGVIIGPTGGYLAGYLLCAWVIGFVTCKWGYSYFKLAVAMILGTLGCYVLGTVWFMYVTGNPLGAALSYCVIPFLPGDMVKVAVGAFLVRRLRIPLQAAGWNLK